MKSESRPTNLDAAGTAADAGNGASSGPSPLELQIARIWAEVLDLDTVGLHDNFLLLGGESLLATQVAAQIRARLGYEISIRSIFVGTVAEVAAELAAQPPPAAPNPAT